MNPSEEKDVREAAERAKAAYDALSPVDKALHDADQRRSFIRGQAGKEPEPNALADEVRRLRTALQSADAWKAHYDNATARTAKYAREIEAAEQERDEWKRSSREWRDLAARNEDRATKLAEDLERLKGENQRIGESMRGYAKYSTLHLERAEAASAKLASSLDALQLAAKFIRNQGLIVPGTILKVLDDPASLERRSGDVAGLARAARSVIDGVKQTEDGRWIVAGDGEVLMCDLADALAPFQGEETADDETVNRLAQELDESPARIRQGLRNLIDRGLIAGRPATPAQPHPDVARLMEACKPFAEAAEQFRPDDADTMRPAVVQAVHFRRLAAALASFTNSTEEKG